VLPDEITERVAGKRPGGDDAVVVGPVDYLPRLGKIIAWGKVAVE
jgi:hypothetical protein